jgi:hypothetical protein
MSETQGELLPEIKKELEAVETKVEQEAAVANDTVRRHATVDQQIALWLASIRNSPVSRSTEAWNHIITRLPDLAAAIKKEI